MKPRLVLVAAALVMASLVPKRGAAQGVYEQESPYPRPYPARAQAFELTAATGYSQGFGSLASGVGLPQVASAGVGVDATIGYRIDPHYSASLGGQYAELNAERDAAVRAFAWGIALQYHVLPSGRVDPWIELGAGYRLLWIEPLGGGPSTLFSGPQLGRVRIGLDFRVTPDVALSPVFGADATMFTFVDAFTAGTVDNPRLSTFLFAGLQGRVDIGGLSVR